MKFFPTILWMVICARGMWTWRHNAVESGKNLAALQGNGDTADEKEVLLAKSHRLMDNLRVFVFLNGLILGVMSILVTAGVSWAMQPLFLRIFSDYLQWVLIGSFAIFMFNGEITAYVEDRIKGSR